MTGTVHIIGAGLAGLACAVRLVGTGRKVLLYEAAGQAGGRCRSYHDDVLDCLIDNGNHLLFSGNTSALAYLEEIGAAHTLAGPARSEISFCDLESGESWTVRPNIGRLPWWIFSAARRVPGTSAVDYLQGLRLRRAGPEATVEQCLDRESVLFRRLWEPLAVAVLNTSTADGDAGLLWAVLRETFGRGEAACHPRMAQEGLSQTFIDPALAYLRANDAEIRFGWRLKGLARGPERDRPDSGTLDFAEGAVEYGKGDSVVLALPPATVATLLPELSVPTGSRAIVNGHFRLARPSNQPPILGLLGGTAQWVFLRDGIASVTVSAADSLAEEPAERIADLLWRDVAKALDRPGEPLPVHRIIKEKRATFAQTPGEASRRPGVAAAGGNLYLAGDWTDTGLPATIEGAVRSGHTAATAIMQ